MNLNYPRVRPQLRTTYSLSTLEVSQSTYDEIHKLLKEVDYQHVFLENGMVDMTGIAIIPKRKKDQ